MLTFKQIEALYWTVRLGTFSASAQKLHTTQSAITKRIQELEADFDIALFDRSGHRAELTARGMRSTPWPSRCWATATGCWLA